MLILTFCAKNKIKYETPLMTFWLWCTYFYLFFLILGIYAHYCLFRKYNLTPSFNLDKWRNYLLVKSKKYSKNSGMFSWGTDDALFCIWYYNEHNFWTVKWDTTKFLIGLRYMCFYKLLLALTWLSVTANTLRLKSLFVVGMYKYPVSPLCFVS